MVVKLKLDHEHNLDIVVLDLHDLLDLMVHHVDNMDLVRKSNHKSIKS